MIGLDDLVNHIFKDGYIPFGNNEQNGSSREKHDDEDSNYGIIFHDRLDLIVSTYTCSLSG